MKGRLYPSLTAWGYFDAAPTGALRPPENGNNLSS
jgi:hypothetical protein